MERTAKAQGSGVDSSQEVAELPYPASSLWNDAWHRLIRNKGAVAGHGGHTYIC